MHELGLARNIISIVGEHCQGRKVTKVTLTLGPLACVEQQALENCFVIVRENTPLENAQLTFLKGERDEFLIKNFEYENDEETA